MIFLLSRLRHRYKFDAAATTLIETHFDFEYFLICYDTGGGADFHVRNGFSSSLFIMMQNIVAPSLSNTCFYRGFIVDAHHDISVEYSRYSMKDLIVGRCIYLFLNDISLAS